MPQWTTIVAKIVFGTLGFIVQIWGAVWVVIHFGMSPLPVIVGAGIAVTILTYHCFSLGWNAGYEYSESQRAPWEGPLITGALSDPDLDALRKLGAKKLWRDE